MAFNVKKLPFPRKLANKKCIVEPFKDGLSADGEQEILFSKEYLCIFDEKMHIKLSKDGKELVSSGVILIEGDISPENPSLNGGNVLISDVKYSILRISRVRNPDGSVNHTQVDLM